MMKKLFLFCAMFLAGTAMFAQFPNVGFLGFGTAGAWDIDINMVTTNGVVYTLDNVAIGQSTQTGVKFRQDDNWTLAWGGAGWPGGTAAVNGPNIPAVPGLYNIIFNRSTLAYTFTPVPISLTGTSVGGWGTDVDFTTNDGINFTLYKQVFTAGEVKWRRNHNWDVTWGNASYPSGTASQVGTGGNITVPAGTYDVTFNTVTGAFKFTNFTGFLHQSGQNIINGAGTNVLLRGISAGGWMVQEGYLMQTSAFAGSQREIRTKIEALIGATNTEAFYQAYRDNGITKADIDWLKSQGFNTIRLPMHYNLYTLPIEQEPVAGQNTWLNEGFYRTDQLLQWCADNQMHLILDMHAAPGGQGKDTNISDYDPSKPSLWESAANRQKMIALWQQLASRYKNCQWIGGYDIINEPNWSFTGSNPNGCDESSNAPLRQLMVDITAAIRQVDTNHIIITEGNCWGNNYNGIFPLWDNNMTLSFHKYGNANTTAEIQYMLNYRSQYNVPIWLGESGENSNVWFRDEIKLMEANNIGWSMWPIKKIESTPCLANVTRPAGYQQLLDYWTNGGTAPTQAFATSVLMQLATNFNFSNITKRTDVIDAMFRQVQTDNTAAFKTHTLPGKVYASDYDLGTKGFAYYDNDSTSGGVYNQGYTGRNDCVDIQLCTDAVTNGFHVGYTLTGEWLQFTIPAAQLKAYSVDIRYAGLGGALHLEDQVGRISETVSLPSTGSYDTWATVTLTGVLVKAGTNKIKVIFDGGGSNLNFLDFKNQTASSSVAFKVIDAGTNDLGDKVIVTFNKDLQSAINFGASNLTLKVNNVTAAISQITQLSNNSIAIKPTTAINAGAVVTFSYAGTNLKAVDVTSLATFTNKSVSNRVGNIQQIPGTIQAESFYVNNGLAIEATTDTGGGQNIGSTDIGDYLDYLVNISQAGNYSIEYRTAGFQTGGIKLQLINAVTQDIQTVSLAPTNGWQTWATSAANSNLAAGRYYVRLLVTAPGFNLNWVKFTRLGANARLANTGESKTTLSGIALVYPNPINEDLLNITIPPTGEKVFVELYNLLGARSIVKDFNAGDGTYSIDTNGLSAGVYIIKIVSGNYFYTTKVIKE